MAINVNEEKVDSLNALLNVVIKKQDYEKEVNGILDKYRKTATVPGFRKGFIPLGLVKKQYGKSILVDEVNKLVQKNLQAYLEEHPNAYLGYPLFKEDPNFSWESEDFEFKFEIGVQPEFKVEYPAKNKVIKYTLTVDDKEIQDQIKSLQDSNGDKLSQKIFNKETSEIEVLVSGLAGREPENIIIEANWLSKAAITSFTDKKAQDVVTLTLNQLLNDKKSPYELFSLNKDENDSLEIEISLVITNILSHKQADLNQEFFDKILGKDTVATEKDFTAKIKEGLEQNYERYAKESYFNDILSSIIEKTKFDLPIEFLKKWVVFSQNEAEDKEKVKKDVEENFSEYEKDIRRQLIIDKILTENAIIVGAEEIGLRIKENIKIHYKQYNLPDPSEETLEEMASNFGKQEDSVKKIHSQLINEKLEQLFQEKVEGKGKKVSAEDFFKIQAERNK